MTETTQTAVLGGGCFWCLEAVFDQLAGVRSVESGYAGGRTVDPSYEAVCSGATGHAEVVRIVFDPAALSFRDLLRVFFSIHDPTTRDRQGNDIGTQYRSVIFCQTPEQKSDAQAVIAELTRRGTLAGADRHRDRRRSDVLSGRELPPGVFRAQRQAAVLPGRRRAQSGQVQEAVRRPAEALARSGAPREPARRPRAPRRPTRIPAPARASIRRRRTAAARRTSRH